MPSQTRSPTGTNALLTALPSKERDRFTRACNTVQLKEGVVLEKPDDRTAHIYFPIDSYISLIASVDGLARLEVGMVGQEGMLGAQLALGVSYSPLMALVQGSGAAYRMSGVQFSKWLESSPALRKEINRYLFVQTSQFAQSSNCARFHHVQARLARWLLMIQDRVGSADFHTTHEFLAYMLGVRRVGITQAARALQSRQLIHYRRGHVTVQDRSGLKKAACPCYARSNGLYERVMGRSALMLD